MGSARRSCSYPVMAPLAQGQWWPSGSPSGLAPVGAEKMSGTFLTPFRTLTPSRTHDTFSDAAETLLKSESHATSS